MKLYFLKQILIWASHLTVHHIAFAKPKGNPNSFWLPAIKGTLEDSRPKTGLSRGESIFNACKR